MVDNYDSFTYNLVQYLQELQIDVTTVRNDQVPLDTMTKDFDFGVISPGPSSPDNSGQCLKVIEVASQNKWPLFGVCLGHQCIGQYFGAEIVKFDPPMHGKVSDIHHHDKGCFEGLPNPMQATRYHSLVIEQKTLPDCLEQTAESADGVIQGVRHKALPIESVQFHPESVLTQNGHYMLAKFVSNCVG